MSGSPPRISWSHWLKGTTWQEGTKGKERSSRSHGTTGKSGKSEMTGPARPRGEKGDKGGTWPKGMPRATGTPGKTGKTGPKKSRGERKIWKNPGQKACRGQLRALENRYVGNDVTCKSDWRWRTYSMSFYCRAGGNPTPSVEWWLKGRKRLSGAKYLVKEGDLVVTNLNYNDTGQYTCAAKNILGSSEASGSLTVRSKKKIYFFYGKQPFKQGLLQANLAVWWLV